MDLHVKNVTNYNLQINYRTGRISPGSLLDIRRGSMRQLMLAPRAESVLRDLINEELLYVVEQLRPAGFMMVEDAKRNPNIKLVGLMSIDIPVKAALAQDMADSNFEKKSYEGEERRRIAAVGVNSTVEKAIDANIKSVQVEMEQTDPFIPSDREPAGKDIRQGFNIERRPEQQAPQPQGRRNRRR